MSIALLKRALKTLPSITDAEVLAMMTVGAIGTPSPESINQARVQLETAFVSAIGGRPNSTASHFLRRAKKLRIS